MDIAVCRHSLSHVLAAAVKRLFPGVKLGIGPAIDSGFYYDFLVPEGVIISAANLEEIEKNMRQLINKDFPFERRELSISEAREFFAGLGEPFKVELIDDLERGGETSVSLYSTGDFVDLCAGPHVGSTKELKGLGLKLDRVAGAYWRGDEKRPMLQRVYGLAFDTKEELEAFIKARAEAIARDHRKIGAELKLFTPSEEVGKGLPLLLPKGAALRRVLERFVVDEELKRGYLHVYTPDIGRKYLYETSGHWEHYKESMYPPIEVGNDEFCLRPMACPHHFMIYKSEPRSYRDLPLRYAEIVSQYRREQSGELTGLIRLMTFHLSDAHILVRPDQLRQEFFAVVDLVQYVMKCLGLTDSISYRASLHDEASDKYVNNPALWESSEKLLMEILDEAGLNYTVGKGEAAFYGPKLDIQIRTVHGKEETIFTLQIDFALPERFDLTYTDSDGTEKRPVVIHRSSIGCLERTMAFLIEHYSGSFPNWLAPVQVRLMTITDAALDYATTVRDAFMRAGIRVELDGRNEKIGKKVREGRLQRIPYLATIGNNEAAEGTLSVRNRDTQAEGSIGWEAFLENVKAEMNGFELTLGAEKAE